MVCSVGIKVIVVVWQMRVLVRIDDSIEARKWRPRSRSRSAALEIKRRRAVRLPCDSDERQGPGPAARAAPTREVSCPTARGPARGPRDPPHSPPLAAVRRQHLVRAVSSVRQRGHRQPLSCRVGTVTSESPPELSPERPLCGRAPSAPFSGGPRGAPRARPQPQARAQPQRPARRCAYGSQRVGMLLGLGPLLPRDRTPGCGQLEGPGPGMPAVRPGPADRREAAAGRRQRRRKAPKLRGRLGPAKSDHGRAAAA